jgi:hypothetical protein
LSVFAKAATTSLPPLPASSKAHCSMSSSVRASSAVAV